MNCQSGFRSGTLPEDVHRRGRSLGPLDRVTSKAKVYVPSLRSRGLSELLVPWRNVNVKEVVCRKSAVLA